MQTGGTAAPIRVFWILAALSLLAAGLIFADEGPPPRESGRRINPLGRSAEVVEAGRALFHERCAVCHGQNAGGGMAANLTRARSVVRGPDGAFFDVIRGGIPGTEMPPQPELPEEAIWQLVSYLHSLARPGEQPPLPGDPEAGRAVFDQAGCRACHLVDGAGGFLGPALDSIGSRKLSADIRRDVIDPDRDLAEGYQTVAIETRAGLRLLGALKNEDLFSLQILTRDGEFHNLRRAEVARLEKPERSLMPDDFGEKLSADDLDNLLAFLDRQRDPFVTVDRGFQNY